MPPRADAEAPGLALGARVALGEAVSLGEDVVVHDDTSIGDRARLGDRAVLGKLPRRSPRSGRTEPEIGGLTVGSDVSIGAGAVVFAGARIGSGAVIGDGACVRERAVIGERARVGPGATVDNDVEVGAEAVLDGGAYLTAASTVEADVVLGQDVITTNDDTMGRHPQDEPLTGAVLRWGCRIGARAVLVPGVELGPEAVVAADSVVTRDISAGEHVAGVPARPIEPESGGGT